MGVGQPFSDEPEALADVRRTDARSAHIGSPDGVTPSFQVSLYKVEPVKAVFACNLFANPNHKSRWSDPNDVENDHGGWRTC